MATTIESIGYAAMEAKAKLTPWRFTRRSLKPNDVLVQIQFSGICHSDIHQAREEWFFNYYYYYYLYYHYHYYKGTCKLSYGPRS